MYHSWFRCATDVFLYGFIFFIHLVVHSLLPFHVLLDFKEENRSPILISVSFLSLQAPSQRSLDLRTHVSNTPDFCHIFFELCTFLITGINLFTLSILQIRRQSTAELEKFKKRWNRAVKEDKEWTKRFGSLTRSKG